MSSGEQKNKDDTYDTSKNNVTPISHDPSKQNGNPGMGEKSKWKMAPELIISVVISNTKDGNLTNSGCNIFTSELHVWQCS